MKKTLLFAITLILSVATVSAQSQCFKKDAEGALVVDIEGATAGGYDLGGYWWMDPGVVLYEDSDVKMEAAIQTAIWPLSWTGINETIWPKTIDGVLNIGNTGVIGQSIKGDEVIEDIATLAGKNHQSAITLTFKKDGKYTATVAGVGNSRCLGLYEIPTESEMNELEYLGKFVGYINFRNDGENGTVNKGPISLEVEVKAGRSYWLVGGSINIYVVEQKFGTGVVDAIESIVNSSETNNNIYSIDGRFVGTEKASLKSGLYITNGKKVVVK